MESEIDDKNTVPMKEMDSKANSDAPQSEVLGDCAAFLSSFSPEEDKAIRRKVDWRFLWLIGLMYIIKTVCTCN
jgi:hypothetical protein